MSNEKEKKKEIFWTENGEPKIKHVGLLKFLEDIGYVKVKIGDNHYVFAKMVNNRLSEADEGQMANDIKDFLIQNEKQEVLEVFVKGVGSYITSKKLDMLPAIENINDRDDMKSSRFYFKNCFCEIDKNKISYCDYSILENPIWEKRIIQKLFTHCAEKGQFEKFCENITGQNQERLLALKTILGYLLHRNKEVGEPRAIILYDENMTQNNQAHGGTGKTLLSMALKECRDVAVFDAKEMKEGSWFKNQRVELTTDVLAFDDLKRNYSFEGFFPMITSGLEVERKREKAFYIDFKNSPKILITSNYYVSGPGGSSDERRRHEFEICNHYNQDFTPEMEFGNRFFSAQWDDDEWSKFYLFMMSCCQDYLQYGLHKIPHINLSQNKFLDGMNEQFIAYADAYVQNDTSIDKREFEKGFKYIYPEMKDTSPHQITKWLNIYASKKGVNFSTNNSGGKYTFILSSNKGQNGI
ncbi:primase-helicase family protein [Flavobacterium aquiphilum]|uniref:primase-helicase family protein n=1 Tax=Flavobacterium aquiphilum TaxID=3003261 RepID=UPI002480A4B1|nr:primase-helicase family protein [Flavobacterium aquiphilum]